MNEVQGKSAVMRSSPLKRFTLAIAALALITAACSGYYPTRLRTGSSEKIETQQAPPSNQDATAPTTPDVGPSQATGSAQTAAPVNQPRKVLAKTSGGTTITQGAGGLPVADIWPASEDRVGISATEIKLCMHAAFALGAAFDNNPADEDVYFRRLNDAGGIFGRKVKIQFTDDAYVAAATTEALNQCKNNNPFLYMGGVGFDQAPAGRSWAETNKLPYLFNLAVEATNLKYSFSFMPSIERNGRTIGQFTGSRFAGKKVGVIYVDTDNWRAGYKEFEKEIVKRGMRVEPGQAHAITNNNHPDFGLIISQMQGAGVNLVLTYINALALNRFIIQADGQLYHPVILSPDGFDLVTDVAGNRPPSQYGSSGDGIDHMRNFPGIYASWVSPAYEMGPPAEKSRASVPWFSEMQEMKAAYKKYGVKSDDRVNDVDWMFWLYSKTVHQMLTDCSKECSRNILAGLMLTGYKTEIVGCGIDFSLGGGRVGGYNHNIYKSEPAGLRSYWRQIETCKSGF